jgi:hypothetical protein
MLALRKLPFSTYLEQSDTAVRHLSFYYTKYHRLILSRDTAGIPHVAVCGTFLTEAFRVIILCLQRCIWVPQVALMKHSMLSELFRKISCL